MIISVEEELHSFVLQKKADFQKICSTGQIRLLISKENIQLRGARAELDAAVPLVNNFLKQIRKSFVSETIINKDQCQVLQ